MDAFNKVFPPRGDDLERSDSPELAFELDELLKKLQAEALQPQMPKPKLRCQDMLIDFRAHFYQRDKINHQVLLQTLTDLDKYSSSDRTEIGPDVENSQEALERIFGKNTYFVLCALEATLNEQSELRKKLEEEWLPAFPAFIRQELQTFMEKRKLNANNEPASAEELMAVEAFSKEMYPFTKAIKAVIAELTKTHGQSKVVIEYQRNLTSRSSGSEVNPLLKLCELAEAYERIQRTTMVGTGTRTRALDNLWSDNKPELNKMVRLLFQVYESEPENWQKQLEAYLPQLIQEPKNSVASRGPFLRNRSSQAPKAHRSSLPQIIPSRRRGTSRDTSRESSPRDDAQPSGSLSTDSSPRETANSPFAFLRRSSKMKPQASPSEPKSRRQSLSYDEEFPEEPEQGNTQFP